MANKVFIRDDSVPTARVGEYGDSCRPFEFVANVLWVDELDISLVAALQSVGAEEVASDDPRYDWITTQGWSRQSQRDYARQPVEEEPDE